MNTLFPSIIYNPATRIFVPKEARVKFDDKYTRLGELIKG